MLLSNNEVSDLIADFLALIIISEFDDFMFSVMTHTKIGELLNEKELEFDSQTISLDAVLEIEVTTSSKAPAPDGEKEDTKIKNEYRDFTATPEDKKEGLERYPKLYFSWQKDT